MSIRDDLKQDWQDHDGVSPRWDAIVNLMDDSIRENVHAELAPCTEQDFWARYDELDPDLGDVTQY